MRIGLVPRKLNLQANYMLLDSEDLLTGRELAYRSRHNVTATLSGWSDRVALDLRYRSRAEQVLAFPLDERGDITLLDLRMGTTIMDMDVQAKVANLLQAEYVDVQERNPGATRSFRITLTSRF
jgi:outer membrane cobalamin receptor